MKISASLMQDLRYLAGVCQWTEWNKDAIKASLKESPEEFSRLLTSLAAAYRVGYEGPNHEGLAVFCATHGIEHPYVDGLAETMDSGPICQDVLSPEGMPHA